MSLPAEVADADSFVARLVALTVISEVLFLKTQGLGVGVEFKFEVVVVGIASTAPRELIVACDSNVDCTREAASNLPGDNKGIPSAYFVLGSA